VEQNSLGGSPADLKSEVCCLSEGLRWDSGEEGAAGLLTPHQLNEVLRRYQMENFSKYSSVQKTVFKGDGDDTLENTIVDQRNWPSNVEG